MSGQEGAKAVVYRTVKIVPTLDGAWVIPAKRSLWMRGFPTIEEQIPFATLEAAKDWIDLARGGVQ